MSRHDTSDPVRSSISTRITTNSSITSVGTVKASNTTMQRFDFNKEASGFKMLDRAKKLYVTERNPNPTLAAAANAAANSDSPFQLYLKLIEKLRQLAQEQGKTAIATIEKFCVMCEKFSLVSDYDFQDLNTDEALLIRKALADEIMLSSSKLVEEMERCLAKRDDKDDDKISEVIRYCVFYNKEFRESKARQLKGATLTELDNIFLSENSLIPTPEKTIVSQSTAIVKDLSSKITEVNLAKISSSHKGFIKFFTELSNLNFEEIIEKLKALSVAGRDEIDHKTKIINFLEKLKEDIERIKSSNAQAASGSAVAAASSENTQPVKLPDIVNVIKYNVDRRNDQTLKATFVARTGTRTFTESERLLPKPEPQGDHVTAYTAFLCAVLTAIPPIVRLRDLPQHILQKLQLAFDNTEKKKGLNDRQKFLLKVAEMLGGFTTASNDAVVDVSSLSTSITDAMSTILHDSSRREICDKIQDQGVKSEVSRLLKSFQLHQSCRMVCTIGNVFVNMINGQKYGSLVPQKKSEKKKEGEAYDNLFSLSRFYQLLSVEKECTMATNDQSSNALLGVIRKAKAKQKSLKVPQDQRRKNEEITVNTSEAAEQFSSAFYEMFDLDYTNLNARLIRVEKITNEEERKRTALEVVPGMIRRHFRCMSILSCDFIHKLFTNEDERGKFFTKLAKDFIQKTFEAEGSPISVLEFEDKKNQFKGDLELEVVKIMKETLEVTERLKIIPAERRSGYDNNVAVAASAVAADRRSIRSYAVEEPEEETRDDKSLNKRINPSLEERTVRIGETFVVPAAISQSSDLLRDELEKIHDTAADGQKILIPIHINGQHFGLVQLIHDHDHLTVNYIDPLGRTIPTDAEVLTRIVRVSSNILSCDTGENVEIKHNQTVLQQRGSRNCADITADIITAMAHGEVVMSAEARLVSRDGVELNQSSLSEVVDRIRGGDSFSRSQTSPSTPISTRSGSDSTSRSGTPPGTPLSVELEKGSAAGTPNSASSTLTRTEASPLSPLKPRQH